jgi:hypothetical protein
MADKKTVRQRIGQWMRPIKNIGGGNGSSSLASISVKVDDSPGWGDLTGRPHDYSQAETVKIYEDSLEAWRKNPIAWRIVAITSDYVLGDKVMVSSPNRRLDRFINKFWSHPQNRMDLRIEPMCHELSRAGDLFVLLFRNEIDGMSYIRFVTKDRIRQIKTASNDWEHELAYYELQDMGDPKKWIAAGSPEAEESDSVMLHYTINKPIGALMGESDLVTMIPWLQRYSRMLEDRVRLNWAMRAFLWVVTVPTDKVKAKIEQYRTPPDAGSIIVKDEAEKWEPVTPSLRGADARNDLMAVRNMIDAGSGYPPHWRGEASNANLATATAMQAPTERHLLRRQEYFEFILADIIYQAYTRAVEIGKERPLPTDDYKKLFNLDIQDVSRTDNEMLARSSHEMAQTFKILCEQMPRRSKILNRKMIGLIFRFMGVPQADEELDMIIEESEEEGPKNEEGGQGKSGEQN